MSYDPLDVGQGALTSLLKQCLLFASAVWTGSLIGGMGLMAGLVVNTWGMGSSYYPMISAFWAAPVLLVSLWGIPNLAVLLLGIVYFVKSENARYLAWIILVGIESLVVMLGWTGSISPEWIPRLAAWIGWLATLSMAASGVWLLRNYHINRWARQMAAIKAENATRIAEHEARERAAAAAGAHSIGAGEMPDATTRGGKFEPPRPPSGSGATP